MTEMMWAAQLKSIGQALEISRIAVPRPGPGELLVKLDASGICHTDLHVIEGPAFPAGAPQPLTLGHEGIGRVVEQGAGTKLAIGTRVGLPWTHDTCEKCRSCQTGWESYCSSQRAHGYSVNGTFAEYAIVQERYAVIIPSALDSVLSAPHMCAGITAFGGVEKAKLSPGKISVVVGCGGLGQYGIQLAKLTGASVVAIDTNELKLKEAKSLGADECLLADKHAAAKVMAMGDADAVLNFAPSSRIWDMVTGMVNNMATIVAVAMVKQPVPLVMEWLTYNGVNITGTSVGTRQQMKDFLQIAERHKIGVDVESVGLKDVNAALQRLTEGSVKGRCVIDFSNLKK